MLFPDILVLVRGAGDLGTGVIYRLRQGGFPVICSEVAQPTVVRRTVAFAQAVYSGRHTVEGMTAERVETVGEAVTLAAAGRLPLLVAASDELISQLRPVVLVDARMLKRRDVAAKSQAPLVIGLGPGFHGGVNCHAAVETNRGHFLGRVWWDRATEADTGMPGATLGYRSERLLRAPAAGQFRPLVELGDHVEAGQEVAMIESAGGSVPVVAALTGLVRGLLYPGLPVQPGMKVGDVDPRDDPAYLHTISEKSLAIGGGVLSAILSWLQRPVRH